jgi:hypothetical protein
VAGVAWAQHVGIERVEVRVDGGDWVEARLSTQDSIDTWRQWLWEWDAPRGTHLIEVRATDANGITQTPHPATPAPNGATGWHHSEVEIQ